MKRLFLIAIVLSTFWRAQAQTPPPLNHKLETDGSLTLRWPVQTIVTASTNLTASYQLELGSEIGRWNSEGELLRGDIFPNHVASLGVDGLDSLPVTFFRVRVVFDFTGGNFTGKTIRNAPLRNSVFTGANFFGAHLEVTSFDGADLAAADFRFATMADVSAAGADLTLARLSDADLTSANLTNANLVLADFSGAKLTFADLSGSDLRGAIIQDVDSNFTRLHNTTVDENTIFDRRTLAIWLIVNGKATNRAFTDVDLSFADLSSSDLTNAKLVGLDLSGVDFTNSDLSGANLTNAILRIVDLRGAKMSADTIIASKWRVIWDIINNPMPDRSHPGIDLSLGFWIGSTLERADVHGSDFTRGIMDDVNFEGANGAAARFNNVEFRGANFKNADLRGAAFNNGFLERVNFLGANLTLATFVGATFRNTTMPDGSIRN